METKALKSAGKPATDVAPAQARERETGHARANLAAGAALTREQALEQRYVEQINALLADANEHDALVIFAEVVTWKLAVLAYRCGPAATGDIVRRFGGHLEALAQQERAEREADEARKQGRLPH